MSTNYRFIDPVPFEKVIQVAKDAGLEIHRSNDDGQLPLGTIILCDGTNYLYADTVDGSDTGFTRYGANDPEFILEVLEPECGEIISEYDDRFFFDEEDKDGAQEIDNPSVG